LLRAGHYTTAALNVALNVVLTMLAVWAGFTLVTR
jgi:fluoride ion exporter CrcB/FEX